MKVSSTSERLKQIINERHLKQSQIIEEAQPFCEQFQVKLGKTDLSQYVNGKVEPGQKKLSILALTLKVSEAWLMGYDVPMSISGKTSGFGIHKNLNGGRPYLLWQESVLIDDYVKKQQAEENVSVIPIFDIDMIGIGTFSGKIPDYYPLIFNNIEYKKSLIYVRNNPSYTEFKDRMYPLIEENDIILLDFEAEPENGDLVLMEYMAGKYFFCRYFKYDDFSEYQFLTQKSIRIENNDQHSFRYRVKGVVKQIIKNL